MQAIKRIRPEHWLPIPSYEGLYEVSDLGRVRSYYKGKHGLSNTPKILRLHPTPKGYIQAVLSHIDGKKITVLVHRLVLLAFVGPLPVGCESLHGRAGKSNNALYNLRYGTKQENAQDKVEYGEMPKGERHYRYSGKRNGRLECKV